MAGAQKPHQGLTTIQGFGYDDDDDDDDDDDGAATENQCFKMITTLCSKRASMKSKNIEQCKKRVEQ